MGAQSSGQERHDSQTPELGDKLVAHGLNHCGVRLSPGPRSTSVSPGWESGTRERVTGISMPLGLTRNKRGYQSFRRAPWPPARCSRLRRSVGGRP